MTQTYKPQHLRDDDVEPCPVLEQALKRRAAGSTRTRAASEEEQ